RSVDRGDALVGILANSDGSEASFSGRSADLGIAWVYYPRSVLDGFMLEAGALRRARDVSVHDSNRTPERVTTTTTVYDARARHDHDDGVRGARDDRMELAAGPARVRRDGRRALGRPRVGPRAVRDG